MITTNLNAGTGWAWAGQVRDRVELANRVMVRLSVPKENFGFVPPMGSEKLSFVISYIFNLT